MSMPSFKPTKWKLEYCTDCKKMLLGKHSYRCRRDHSVIERDNVPFFIPDMRVIGFYGKWITLKSKKLNQEFSMITSNFADIVLHCGIKPKGYIPDQWWMFCKMGVHYL